MYRLHLKNNVYDVRLHAVTAPRTLTMLILQGSQCLVPQNVFFPFYTFLLIVR